MKKPEISFRGMTFAVKENDHVKRVFDWVNAVADAGIIMGLTFFTTLSAQGLTGIEYEKAISTAIVASMIEFFMILALKRGIRSDK